MNSRIRWLAAVAMCSVAPTTRVVVAQSTSQAAATYSLTGTITGLDGAALADAQVTILIGRADSVKLRSDTAGHFRASGLALATVTIYVRRLGYQPKSVDVTITHEPIYIVLEPNPAELGTVKVREVALERDDRLRDFYARRDANSFGRYYELADIEKRHPQFISEMLRTTPGVNLVPSSRGGYTLRIRGCAPLVWVDGVRVPNTQLDEVVTPSDVAGMEVYSSFAGVPAQYFDRSATCGTVLVWSRAK